MAIPTRATSHGTFFITTQTHNRRRLFQVDANATLFIETLQHYRREGLYKLHAFVVMPDHIHLLLTTDDLATAMQRIKGGFSHKLASKIPVWQRGFTDHLVLNRDQFQSRREYIRQNPVRSHLVAAPEQYPHSSAFSAQVERAREASTPLCGGVRR